MRKTTKIIDGSLNNLEDLTILEEDSRIGPNPLKGILK